MRESILQRMLISRSFARTTMVAGCLASETSHGPRWPSWNCTVHVWLYAWPSFCSRFCAFLFVVQIFQVKQPIELSIRQRKFEQSIDALRMFITLQKIGITGSCYNCGELSVNQFCEELQLMSVSISSDWMLHNSANLVDFTVHFQTIIAIVKFIESLLLMNAWVNKTTGFIKLRNISKRHLLMLSGNCIFKQKNLNFHSSVWFP